MRFKFTVVYMDGTSVEASIGTADQVAFELQFDRAITTLADQFRLSDACWLAWHSLKRGGLTAGFDEWLETVEEVAAARDDVVPLETTAPTG